MEAIDRVDAEASDWILMAPAVLGPEANIPIDMVLLHPLLGVALVEFEPKHTTNAKVRFLEGYDRTTLPTLFAGAPPVVHVSVRREDIQALPERVIVAFEAEAAPALVGGGAWVRPVQRLLRPKQPPAPEGDAWPGSPVRSWTLIGLLLAAWLSPWVVVAWVGAGGPPVAVQASLPPPAVTAPAPAVAIPAPEPVPEAPAAAPAPLGPPRYLSDPERIEMLLRRGRALVDAGDFDQAVAFFARAADAGSVEGALAAGRALEPDADAADAWYRKAEAIREAQSAK